MTRPEPLAVAVAVDRLYAAFADVRRPRSIDYCSHCFTAVEEQALLAPVTLRRLPVEAVRPYAADVLLTVGGIDDFRYFLPRLLEIACTVGFSWPDLEPLAGRLRLAGWLTWPVCEHRAVRDVLKALWAQTLAAFPSEPSIDAVLCAIGNAEDDLGPYLSDWVTALPGTAAAAQLGELLNYCCRPDGGRWRPTNAFWDGREHQVTAWLAGAELRRAVTVAFSATDDEDTLRTLACIHDLLGADTQS